MGLSALWRPRRSVLAIGAAHAMIDGYLSAKHGHTVVALDLPWIYLRGDPRMAQKLRRVSVGYTAARSFHHPSPSPCWHTHGLPPSCRQPRSGPTRTTLSPLEGARPRCCKRRVVMRRASSRRQRASHADGSSSFSSRSSVQMRRRLCQALMRTALHSTLCAGRVSDGQTACAAGQRASATLVQRRPELPQRERVAGFLRRACACLCAHAAWRLRRASRAQGAGRRSTDRGRGTCSRRHRGASGRYQIPHAGMVCAHPSDDCFRTTSAVSARYSSQLLFKIPGHPRALKGC